MDPYVYDGLLGTVDHRGALSPVSSDMAQLDIVTFSVFSVTNNFVTLGLKSFYKIHLFDKRRLSKLTPKIFFALNPTNSYITIPLTSSLNIPSTFLLNPEGIPDG